MIIYWFNNNILYNTSTVFSLSAITYHLVVVLLYKHDKTTTADRLRVIKYHILNINLACPTLEKEEKQGHR